MSGTEWQQNPDMFYERSCTLTNKEARASGLFDQVHCSPKAEVSRSNRDGCANFVNNFNGLCLRWDHFAR